MNLSPSYPTINPMTYCQNSHEYGTWTINRELNRLDALNDEKQCVNTPKNKNERKGNDVESTKIDPLVYSNINLMQGSQSNKLIDKSNNTCETNVLQSANTLHKYCRKMNGNAIDPLFLIDGCKVNEFEMKCINPDSYSSVGQKIKCQDNQGVYLCPNGRISCTPCNFDRLQFEKRINDGFLKRKCRPGDTNCMKTGTVVVNPNKPPPIIPHHATAQVISTTNPHPVNHCIIM